MIQISEAVKLINDQTRALGRETVDLAESVNRVLAEPVVADMDLPPFDRSQMDGFAVRSEDTRTSPARLRIIGESVAGKGFDRIVGPGEAVRIMTGARVPTGADAVQKVELTNERDGLVEILEPAAAKQNIVGCGEEIRSGTGVFASGEIITANMIAALASFGYAKVKVSQRPRISILSTGSEIVGIADKPRRDQIRNSNSIMLKVFAEKLGLEAGILPLVHDDLETLKQTIASAVGLEHSHQSAVVENAGSRSKRTQAGKIGASNPDPGKYDQNPTSEILLITGGVSVGDYDFTKPALRELGAEILFEKVSLKPGKPTVFAKLNDVLIFGLPGNPVSVAVTFYLFVRAAALRMQAAANCDLRRGFAVASTTLKGARERDSVLPVSVATNDRGQLMIETLRFSGSSNFIAFSRADALAVIPKGKTHEKGDVSEVLFL